MLQAGLRAQQVHRRRCSCATAGWAIPRQGASIGSLCTPRQLLSVVGEHRYDLAATVTLDSGSRWIASSVRTSGDCSHDARDRRTLIDVTILIVMSYRHVWPWTGPRSQSPSTTFGYTLRPRTEARPELDPATRTASPLFSEHACLLPRSAPHVVEWEPPRLDTGNAS